MKDILPLSIEGTPENASTFTRWYLYINDPDEIELNIGECEVHDWNVSTTIRRNYLDSLTINSKDFDGDPIISHKLTMEQLSKGNSIYSSVVNDDLLNIQK